MNSISTLKSLGAKQQFPAITEFELSDLDNSLGAKWGIKDIPEALKDLYQNFNGASFLDSNYDTKVMVKLDLPFLEETTVAGIFGVYLQRFKNEYLSDEELPDLMASNENSKDNFDVLPNGMMSFAYEYDSSGALFAVDTFNNNQVYFYTDMHLYSIFGKKKCMEKSGHCFFGNRAAEILSRYKIINEVDIEVVRKKYLDWNFELPLTTEMPEACALELEHVPFIHISDSVESFIASLYIGADDE